MPPITNTDIEQFKIPSERTQRGGGCCYFCLAVGAQPKDTCSAANEHSTNSSWEHVPCKSQAGPQRPSAQLSKSCRHVPALHTSWSPPQQTVTTGHPHSYPRKPKKPFRPVPDHFIRTTLSHSAQSLQFRRSLHMQPQRKQKLATQL